MDLLSLPSEVLGQIFDFLREDGDIDSLRASLLVCRAMQGAVEHALYHTITFRKRSSMQMLARALEADPQRLRYIQDLQLQWSTHDYNHGEIQPPDLAAMLNLRRLLSESPECQPWSVKKGEWKPDMQNCLDAFEKASLRSTLASPKPLEHLLSLTLHWSGDDDRFWSAKPSCPIFLHPTLREIKISCVSIVSPKDDNDAEWAAELATFRHKTPLESLHFEESLVSPRALEAILSLPRALKQFRFHEVSHHRPSVARFLKEMIGSDVKTLGAALEQQSGSLEHLSLHSSAYLRRPRGSPAYFVLSLGIFRDLKTIELGHQPTPRSEPVWMLAWPLPPYLEQLRLTEFCPDDVEAVEKSLVAMLRIDELIRNAQALGHTFHLDIWLPSIHYNASLSMDAEFSRFEPIIRTLDGTILAGRQRPYPRGLAEGPEPNTTKEEEGNATPQPWPRVSIMSVKKMGNYIPPYLHGERRPVLTPLFDSHDGWLSKALLDSYQEEVQRGMGDEPSSWELLVQDDGEEENDDEEAED